MTPPISLTLNYVSQIDRPFTWLEMLETTGQSADKARVEFNRLLDEGRLVEVKGASVMHYRYRVLAPGRSLNLTERDNLVRNVVAANPGLHARQIGVMDGVALAQRTIIRSLNRLIADGKVERWRSRYWITGTRPPKTRKPMPVSAAKIDRTAIIWNLLSTRVSGVTCRTVAQAVGCSDRTAHRYLAAMIAAGHVTRERELYYAVDPSYDEITIGSVKGY